MIRIEQQKNDIDVYSKKPVTVMVYLCSYIHTALESRTPENCYCICSWKTTTLGGEQDG